MALPTSYLTSSKNLDGILNAIVNAQAPEKFTQRFLESLGFTSSADRLIVGVLKSTGILGDDGRPTQRYYDYLDQSQSQRVLAEGIIEAYADLFQVNKAAYNMGHGEIVNKMRTLSQGQHSDSVLKKMAMTFLALCKLADFTGKPRKPKKKEISDTIDTDVKAVSPAEIDKDEIEGLKLGGLVYNIQLILPESRDPKVYDALFQALRRHLK